MADAENIEMKDIGREEDRAPEETPEEGETSFDDNLLEQRPDPNKQEYTNYRYICSKY